MDAALIRERENFKKRALALPTVEKKTKKEDHVSKKPRPPSKY